MNAMLAWFFVSGISLNVCAAQYDGTRNQISSFPGFNTGIENLFSGSGTNNPNFWDFDNEMQGFNPLVDSFPFNSQAHAPSRGIHKTTRGNPTKGYRGSNISPQAHIKSRVDYNNQGNVKHAPTGYQVSGITDKDRRHPVNGQHGYQNHRIVPGHDVTQQPQITEQQNTYGNPSRSADYSQSGYPVQGISSQPTISHRNKDVNTGGRTYQRTGTDGGRLRPYPSSTRTVIPQRNSVYPQVNTLYQTGSGGRVSNDDYPRNGNYGIADQRRLNAYPKVHSHSVDSTPLRNTNRYPQSSTNDQYYGASQGLVNGYSQNAGNTNRRRPYSGIPSGTSAKGYKVPLDLLHSQQNVPSGRRYQQQLNVYPSVQNGKKLNTYRSPSQGSNILLRPQQQYVPNTGYDSQNGFVPQSSGYATGGTQNVYVPSARVTRQRPGYYQAPRNNVIYVNKDRVGVRPHDIKLTGTGSVSSTAGDNSQLYPADRRAGYNGYSNTNTPGVKNGHGQSTNYQQPLSSGGQSYQPNHVSRSVTDYPSSQSTGQNTYLQSSNGQASGYPSSVNQKHLGTNYQTASNNGEQYNPRLSRNNGIKVPSDTYLINHPRGRTVLTDGYPRPADSQQTPVYQQIINTGPAGYVQQQHRPSPVNHVYPNSQHIPSHANSQNQYGQLPAGGKTLLRESRPLQHPANQYVRPASGGAGSFANNGAGYFQPGGY